MLINFTRVKYFLKSLISTASKSNININNLRSCTKQHDLEKIQRKEKQLYGYFKRQYKDISYEITNTLLTTIHIKK